MRTEIVAAVSAVATALFGAAIWFLKSFIGNHIEHAVKHEYDERLEAHKAELQRATEQFKSELGILAHERQLRFAHLHEKAAEVVSGTYQRLWAVQRALGAYVSLFEVEAMGSKEDRRKELGKKIEDFQTFFYPRRLFLPRPLAEAVAAFEGKLLDLTREFMFGVEHQNEDLRARGETWAKVNRQLEKEAIPLYSALEDQFRMTLGVEIIRPSLSGDKVQN